MTTLFIVRHGNTFEAGEAPRRIGARTDLPLVESGRAQARALAERFAADGIRFGRVLAGLLRRTQETAALIAGDGVPAERIPALAEIDHGPDEDRPEQAVVDRVGAAALAAWERDGVAPDGWRVDAEVRTAWWRACFAEAGADADGSWLLVTSNGAARFALLADPRLRAAAARLPSLKLRTGAWGSIRVDGGVPTLLEWDRRP